MYYHKNIDLGMLPTIGLLYSQYMRTINNASPAIAKPPYSKGITSKDAPAAATPIPLANISASPIRL